MILEQQISIFIFLILGMRKLILLNHDLHFLLILQLLQKLVLLELLAIVLRLKQSQLSLRTYLSQNRS